jgi:hypothetical protein
MFDWPLQIQTSPTTTLVSVTVSVPAMTSGRPSADAFSLPNRTDQRPSSAAAAVAD